MMARSRRKGGRIEREIVGRCRDAGIDAARVPLSGSAAGIYSGDISISLGDDERLLAEVKSRGNGSGFRLLARWLDGRDLVFLREDRSEPVVAMPWGTWLRLMRRGGKP